jgi:histidinol-phosphate/aromatic aminotransferase/cobyric acid decarboxylase-like protein
VTDQPDRRVLAVATETDRATIYRLRHDVYASELGQHATNVAGALSDDLDAANVYLVAKRGDDVVGFVAITPPTSPRYSIEKYVDRTKLPFAFDAGLFEIRLLTVVASERGRATAGALMYAALRWVEAHGGTHVEAIGRREVVGLYARSGLRCVGIAFTSGRVTFEVMHASVSEIRAAVDAMPGVARVERLFDWRLDFPMRPATAAYHGGAFFDAVGDTFESLDRRDDVINADVLDAWFAPSPRVVEAVAAHLEWLLRTSPPTGCEGLLRVIAETRGVGADHLVPGGGSSELIYTALRRWLRPGDRALVLDPSYGEYAHLLGNVIGCRVERFELRRDEGWRVDPERLATAVAAGHDVVVLVNPNSPTGIHAPRAALEEVLRRAPTSTRFWIDETYVDYAGADASLERFAAASTNVVVCKSMSKVYALSGARCAYLCAPKSIVDDLRAVTPPWAVGLVGQVAAVEALRDPAWYEARWRETAALRDALARELAATLSAEVVPGVANFLLLHLPREGPRPADLVARCRARGLFLRDFPDAPRLAQDSLRIAVKDAATNARMLAILRDVVG